MKFCAQFKHNLRKFRIQVFHKGMILSVRCFWSFAVAYLGGGRGGRSAPDGTSLEAEDLCPFPYSLFGLRYFSALTDYQGVAK